MRLELIPDKEQESYYSDINFCEVSIHAGQYRDDENVV